MYNWLTISKHNTTTTYRCIGCVIIVEPVNDKWQVAKDSMKGKEILGSFDSEDQVEKFLETIIAD